MIDTHCHLDGEEFAQDLETVITRAREAGVEAVGVPGIDLKSCQTVLDLCHRYEGYCFPMLGLHPEEVKSDWREVLSHIRQHLPPSTFHLPHSTFHLPHSTSIKAIGEVGLDFYWSREFEQEQLLAFEEQVRWSVELQLPLMIHCRKAQNEMVAILKKYKDQLPGGVFHCFTGNTTEARQLLDFDRFVLGIGGVLTFKKSNLPATLASTTDGVPLERLVLETDAPYMAPVPLRGQRNEPAFIRHVITRLAAAYGVSEEDICRHTNANVRRVFAL